MSQHDSAGPSRPSSFQPSAAVAAFMEQHSARLPDGYTYERGCLVGPPAGTTRPRPAPITYKPIAAVALLHTAGGTSWALRLVFLDFNDQLRELDVMLPALQTRDTETVRAMTQAGLPLISGEAAALFKCLAAFPMIPDLPRILTFSSMGFTGGWDKSNPDRLTFAMPAGCLVADPDFVPPQASERPTQALDSLHVHPGLQVLAEIHPEYLEPYHASGSLQEWCELAALVKGNHLLTFFLAAAFAAPLLHVVGGENAYLHAYGPSSTGKTTAGQVAGSVMGRAGDPQQSTKPTVIARWHSTANGLELVNASRSGVGLVIDELGSLSVVLDLYAAAGGVSKVRMTKELGFTPNRRWSVLALSTGEVSMAEAMQEHGKRKPKVGERVRGIDIPALMLSSVDGLSPADAAVRARQIKRWSAERYGVAGPVFAQQLLNRYPTLPELHDAVTQVVDEVHPALISVLETNDRALNAAERRTLRQFALVLAAGWLAIEVGVLPLEEDDVSSAVEASARSWLSASQAMDESKSAIDSIRHYVLANQGQIFNVDDDVESTAPRQTYAMFYKGLILMTEQQFAAACDGLNPFHAMQSLKAAGLLKTEGEKHKLRVTISRLSMPSTRFIAIRFHELFKDGSSPRPSFAPMLDQTRGDDSDPT